MRFSARLCKSGLRLWSRKEKRAKGARNNFEYRKINPLAMQRRRVCATTEPSGQSFLSGRYDTAIFCFSKGLPSSSSVPDVPDVPFVPQKRPRIGKRFRCLVIECAALFKCDALDVETAYSRPWHILAADPVHGSKDFEVNQPAGGRSTHRKSGEGISIANGCGTQRG